MTVKNERLTVARERLRAWRAMAAGCCWTRRFRSCGDAAAPGGQETGAHGDPRKTGQREEEGQTGEGGEAGLNPRQETVYRTRACAERKKQKNTCRKCFPDSERLCKRYPNGGRKAPYFLPDVDFYA